MTATLNGSSGPRLANKPRAAIYTRVSTANQENGASLTTQKGDCTRYAEVNGLIVTHEYLDVQSGLESDREQYQAMLRAAQGGEFDRIIVWKMDRFGRDRIESGFQLRALQQIGVRVDSATEPNDSALLRNILMDFAEEESRRISLRVSANQRTRAQNGRRTSPPPFGYSNVQHPEGGRTLSPNEDAPVVREAFQRYASGRYSLADMRSYISQVSSSKDRPQTRAGVQLLLKNPAYAGINRHGYYARSKIQVKSRDERLAEVVEVDGCHEPLVDRDTFEKVQLRLESNRPQKSGRPHAAFLFTGVIWCACGSRYSGKRSGGGKRVTYYCGRRNNAGDCDSRSVSESRIREVVLTPIKHLLAQLKQKDLRKAVRAELVNQMEGSRSSVRQAEEVLSDKLKRLESRLSRLEDGYFDEVISRDRYLTRRDEILVQIADINSSLGARARPVSVDFDQLYALAESITIETLDDQSWRALVESMVERIVIEDTGDGRKDPPKINVHWKPEYVPIINREV